MLASEKLINGVVLQRCKNKFITEMTGTDDDPFLSFARKNVHITYKGFRCQVGVSSLLEHFTLACWATVRTIAVNTGQLDPLFFELDLLPASSEHQGISVDTTILVEAKNPRAQAKKLLDIEEEITGELIAQTLASKRGLLCSLDATWKVEKAF